MERFGLFLMLVGAVIGLGCRNQPTLDPFMSRAVIAPPPTGSYTAPPPPYHTPNPIQPGPLGTNLLPPGTTNSPGGWAHSGGEAGQLANPPSGWASAGSEASRPANSPDGSDAVRPATFTQTAPSTAAASQNSPLRIVDPNDDFVLLPVPADDRSRLTPANGPAATVPATSAAAPASSSSLPRPGGTDESLPWQPARR